MFYTGKTEYLNCMKRKLWSEVAWEQIVQAFFTCYLSLQIDMTVLMEFINLYLWILEYLQMHLKINLINCCHSANRLQVCLVFPAQILMMLTEVETMLFTAFTYFTAFLCQCNSTVIDLLYSTINRVMPSEV